MKIAIIGASGEVGFRLVQKLCLNYQLICIVRDKKKKDFSKLSNIALFEISDVSKTQELSSALTNVDVVINAGYIFFAQHIFAAINCLESKPKHIIFTGSTGVFTKLPSFDADLKRDAELFIEPFVCLKCLIAAIMDVAFSSDVKVRVFRIPLTLFCKYMERFSKIL